MDVAGGRAGGRIIEENVEGGNLPITCNNHIEHRDTPRNVRRLKRPILPIQGAINGLLRGDIGAPYSVG